MEAIGNFKISAAGHDEIVASLVKSVSSSVTETNVLYIVTKSMQSCIVPKNVKLQIKSPSIYTTMFF
jgi:hypothetical protein